MTNEQAAVIVADAFRGMRFRLQHDGLLDLIVARMTGLLVACVADKKEECAKIAENWGTMAPRPEGRRAMLAKEIRESA